MIENIFLFLFIVRPIVDLAWQKNLFMGMNLAGLVAILIILMTVVYFPFRMGTKYCFAFISGLIYIFYIFLCTVLNCTTFTDFNYFLRLLSEFSFLVIVAPRLSLNKMNHVIGFFVIVTLVPIFITFLQVAGVVKYTYFDYLQGTVISRGSGGYRQPSVLTRFCSIGLLYALYLLEIIGKCDKRRVLLWAYIGLNLAAVIFSYHRTGYFLVVFIVGLWFFLKDRKRVMKLLFMGGLALCSVVIVFAVLYKLQLISVKLSVLKDMLSLSNIVSRAADGSINGILRGRGKILSLLFEGFRTNPFRYTLFGNGVNENPVTHIAIVGADMELIRVLWNGGIIGAVLWFIHFVSMFFDIARWRREKGINAFYRLAMVMFWCFIVWGLCIEATESPDLMYHVYLVCGWMCFSKNVKSSNGGIVRLNEKSIVYIDVL